MLCYIRYAMHVTVYIIFINFDKHSFEISYIVTLVWPPKGLRNRLVARGRKRLCTTALYSQNLVLMLHPFFFQILSSLLKVAFALNLRTFISVTAAVRHH